jgi:hypothetical protein
MTIVHLDLRSKEKAVTGHKTEKTTTSTKEREQIKYN